MSDSASRVRIAYFVPPSKQVAGIERVVHEIATALMASHADLLDVHVVFSSRYDDELLDEPAYTPHVLGVERLRGLGPALRGVVAREHVDVLVCPQVEASVIGWLATRGIGLPVFVAHLHGNPRIEEEEGTRRTRVAFALFRHVVSPRADGVLTVSPSLARYAAEAVAPRAPVHFAPNPVRDLAGSVDRSPPGDRFRFVTVARLSRQKGQDILLRALAIARPRLPPVLLSLVGSGPEEPGLRRLCRDLGLDDVVEFSGHVGDPTDYLRAADCFVLPSRWEGFGVVLVEALRFGVPLLAADCEFGPADVVTDPVIGDLVEPGSPEALAAGLERAVERRRDPQGDAARRATTAEYDVDQATDQHLAVLRKVVGARPRPAHLAAFARP